MDTDLEVNLLFPTAVARGNFPQFVDQARIVMRDRLQDCDINEWNVCQSSAMFDDSLNDLLSLIARNSFQILTDQGFDMDNKRTIVKEFWGQEFTRTGQHTEHVHGNNAQITGFYFVDVPENSSFPHVFDPRYGKRQINLTPKNWNDVTYASTEIGFSVKPGDLILFNSWLPHGFSRSKTDEQFRFIHFNVMVEDVPHEHGVEVI